MKPTVEAKHVFGEKKPRLIRTKRALGGLATMGESRHSIEYRSRWRTIGNKDVAQSSGNFIRELSGEYKQGFVAETETEKASIQLESVNGSASIDYLKPSPQYNEWTLRITTKADKGKTHMTIIKGSPFWRHPQDLPGVVSGVRLVTVDPETSKEHHYYGDDQDHLQNSVDRAFRQLRHAQMEGDLEIRPIESEEVAVGQAA